VTGCPEHYVVAPNSAEILRTRVRAAVEGRGRRRALMRAMGLKSQGTITQWLDYKAHNPGVDKLDAIAGFVGCSVANLFVAPADDLTHSVTPGGVHSEPHHGGTNGAAIDSIRVELAELRAENDRLRAALADLIAAVSPIIGHDDGPTERTTPRQSDRRRRR